MAAYVLCSPHNPTGSVWSQAQLGVIGDICARRGVVLLVDEIHAPLLPSHLGVLGSVAAYRDAVGWLDALLALAVSPGPDFGAEGRGFARLNMGTSPALLEEAVRRMAAAVEGAEVLAGGG